MNFPDMVKAHEAANERGSVNALVAHKHRGELIELVREMMPYMKHTEDCDNVAFGCGECDCGLQTLLDRLEGKC